MKLKCHRLNLSVEPLTKEDSEGWLHFQIKVQVPGFSGNFKAEMQLEDLETFRANLSEMEKGIGDEREALLSSAEPGIYISLKSNKLGNIEGEYQFESDRYEGEPTCLSGAFAIDQTFLKPLLVTVSEDIKIIKG